MRPLILGLALLAGCAGTIGAVKRADRNETLRRTNRVGLAMALAATACDWAQTSWAMGAGGFEEQNGSLGAAPSQAHLAEYMVGSMAVTTAVWWLLPDVAKPVVWGRTLGVEAAAVANNVGEGAPVCGLPQGGPATLARTAR